MAVADRLTAKRGPRERKTHIPGEAGLWIPLMGDMSVFAVLFTIFLVERRRSVTEFDAAQRELSGSIAIVNAVLLLTSSLLVVAAVTSARQGDTRRSRLLLSGAICLGLGFVALKTLDYQHMIDSGRTPQTNGFYMLFYVVTGLHLAHVVVGIVVLAVISAIRGAPTLTRGRRIALEGGACFWHMVDLLWLIILPLFYLVR